MSAPVVLDQHWEIAKANVCWKMAKKKAAPTAPSPAPPPAAPPAVVPVDEKPTVVEKPAVVDKPVVVEVKEVKAAAVVDTSGLEATAKAAAASSSKHALQDFTTVVAARRARMVQLPSPRRGPSGCI